VCPGSPPSIGHGERPYEGRSGALAAPTGGTPNATTTVATIIIRPTHAPPTPREVTEPPAIPSAGGAYEGLSRGSRVAAEARRDAAETRSSTESESPLGGTRIGIRLGRGDHRPVCTLGHAKPPTRGSMDDEEPAVPRLGELDPEVDHFEAMGRSNTLPRQQAQLRVAAGRRRCGRYLADAPRGLGGRGLVHPGRLLNRRVSPGGLGIGRKHGICGRRTRPFRDEVSHVGRADSVVHAPCPAFRPLEDPVIDEALPAEGVGPHAGLQADGGLPTPFHLSPGASFPPLVPRERRDLGGPAE